MKPVLSLCVGLALWLCALAAQAQFFAEVALGKGLTNYNDFEDQGFSSDRADATWSVGIGYMFNRFVGIEAGYRDLGETGISAPGPQAGAIGRLKFNSPGPLNVRIESAGVFLGPVFETYIERFRLNARMGGYFWSADVTATGAGTFDNKPVPAASSDEGVSPYFGVGASYMLAGGLSAGIAWTRFQILDDLRVDAWDLRLKFSF